MADKVRKESMLGRGTYILGGIRAGELGVS